jgi:uncharacterized membrane protein
MNSAHIHLALSHLPIFGVLIGLIILAYGQFSKKDLLSITGLIFFVATALIAIPVFLTGEDAGKIIKNLPGASDSLIEAHEELAEKAIWLIGALGALSVVALYFYLKARSKFRLSCVIIIVLALVTMGLMINVGNSGGQIRHTEIRTSDIQAEPEN